MFNRLYVYKEKIVTKLQEWRQMHMKKLMLIMICILLVGIDLLSGCEGQEEHREGLPTM